MKNVITEAQWQACELLIDRLVLSYDMSREVAITALSIKDQKRIQAGLNTLVEGAEFGVVYPFRDEPIHEDDIAKIVSYLEAVSIERAIELTKQRIASGIFKAEPQH